MKMTIVIDTDDPAGIRDAFKIASMFYMRYHNAREISSYTKPLKFGKIGLIKLVREYAKESEALAITGRSHEISSLRRAKDFVEGHMMTMRPEDGGSLTSALTDS